MKANGTFTRVVIALVIVVHLYYFFVFFHHAFINGMMLGFYDDDDETDDPEFCIRGNVYSNVLCILNCHSFFYFLPENGSSRLRGMGKLRK